MLKTVPWMAAKCAVPFVTDKGRINFAAIARHRVSFNLLSPYYGDYTIAQCRCRFWERLRVVSGARGAGGGEGGARESDSDGGETHASS